MVLALNGGVFDAFQSSPSPKTGRYTIETGSTTHDRVPILTQSEDWALFLILVHLVQEKFQSSPSPKTGRYIVVQTDGDREKRSNPHPVRRLGAIWSYQVATKPFAVPILTQSEDWAL